MIMNNAYSKVAVKQGTPEWLELRQSKFTASNTAVIVDLHPYKTRLEYFEEKVLGKEKPVTGPHIERGHIIETHGRQLVSADFGIDLNPAVVVSNRIPDFMASLDGFNEEEKINFEAKYVGAEVYDQIFNRQIPVHHRWQIQGQLAATGADSCIYYVEDSKGRKLSQIITPDNEYIDQIVAGVEAFMKLVKSGEAPEPGDRDYVIVDNDPELQLMRQLKDKIDLASKEYDALKKQVETKYSDVNRLKGGGMMMYRSMVKSPIPYSKIPEVMALDLEKHRPKPRFQTTFKKAEIV